MEQKVGRVYLVIIHQFRPSEPESLRKTVCKQRCGFTGRLHIGLAIPSLLLPAVLGSLGRASQSLTNLLGRFDPQVLCVFHRGARGGGETGEVRVEGIEWESR